jgi:hypothetical protein
VEPVGERGRIRNRCCGAHGHRVACGVGHAHRLRGRGAHRHWDPERERQCGIHRSSEDRWERVPVVHARPAFRTAPPTAHHSRGGCALTRRARSQPMAPSSPTTGRRNSSNCSRLSSCRRLSRATGSLLSDVGGSLARNWRAGIGSRLAPHGSRSTTRPELVAGRLGEMVGAAPNARILRLTPAAVPPGAIADHLLGIGVGIEDKPGMENLRHVTALRPDGTLDPATLDASTRAIVVVFQTWLGVGDTQILVDLRTGRLLSIDHGEWCPDPANRDDPAVNAGCTTGLCTRCRLDRRGGRQDRGHRRPLTS